MESGPGPPASDTDELAELELVLFDVQYSLPLQSYLQYFKDNYDSERAAFGKPSERAAFGKPSERAAFGKPSERRRHEASLTEQTMFGKPSESVSNSITQYLKLRVEIAHRWNRLNQKQRQELIHIYRYIKEIDEIVRSIQN